MGALGSAYLLLLLGSASKLALAVRNPGPDARGATVELNRAAKPSERLLVVSRPSPLGAGSAFSRYALFGFENDVYFNASAVTLNGRRLMLDGAELKFLNVYDVFSFWRADRLLALCFRLNGPGNRSQYQYLRVDGLSCSKVDAAQFGAGSNGLLGSEALGKLLSQVDQASSKAGRVSISNFRGVDSTKYTLGMVVVALLLVVILLVFAFFFFFRR